MKWTREYPKVEGWYWIMNDVTRHARLEHFCEGSDGLLSTIDNDYNEYGPQSYDSYWFSNEPIKEPEEWWK